MLDLLCFQKAHAAGLTSGNADDVAKFHSHLGKSLYGFAGATWKQDEAREGWNARLDGFGASLGSDLPAAGLFYAESAAAVGARALGL